MDQEPDKNYNSVSPSLSLTELDRQLVKKLIEKPGECIGETLLPTAKYIKTIKGEEGLKKFEEEMKNLGHPLDFDKINALDWYPVGLRALTFIALRRTFSWGEKELIEMGENLINFSLFLKLFLKFVFPVEKIVQKASINWRKHFTIGKLEGCEFNKKEKYVTLQIHEFKIHPDFCFVFLGYFKKLAELSGKKNVIAEETKCSFRGDKYHEYLIKWE